MATLTEHRDAMVALLANGSGIPASASRLAHAVHDILALLTAKEAAPTAHTEERADATTPGLNDTALSCVSGPVSVDQPCTRPTLLSNDQKRIRQLENTIQQLKTEGAKRRYEMRDVLAERDQLKQQVKDLGQRLDAYRSSFGERAKPTEPQRHGSGSLTAAAVLKEDC